MHPTTFVDILFWFCLSLGGIYLAAVVLMGGISDAAGHMGHVGDALHIGHLGDGGGHHAGHIDAGHPDVGHADGGHADAGHAGDHAHAAEAEGGLARFNVFSYLNPMSLASFLIGFGGIGAICRQIGLSATVSAVWGVAAGWGMWYLAFLVATRIFAASSGTSHNRREALVGLRATVTAPITSSQPGTVCYVVAGSRQTLRALASDEDAIPSGSIVRIRRVDSSTAYVTRMD